MIDVLNNTETLGDINQHWVDRVTAITQTGDGEINHGINVGLTRLHQICRKQSRMSRRVVSHFAKLAGAFNRKLDDERQQRTILIVKNGDRGIDSVRADDANLNRQARRADAGYLCAFGQERLLVNTDQMD